MQFVGKSRRNGLLLLLVVLKLSIPIANCLQNKTSAPNEQASGASQSKRSTSLPTVRQQQALEYAVVVDCGSSGTRATVFTWPRGTPTGQLVYQIKPLERNGELVSRRIRPGLASVRDNPNYASDYMRPIMEFASQNVPADQQATTPVYFLGTAGMRLLTGQEQRAIEEDLRKDLRRDFAFQNLQARVISGVEESVFQWVSINSIAQRLTPHFDLPQGNAINLLVPSRLERSQRRRLALVEMGGASAQVAFEASSSLDDLLHRRLKHSPAAWQVYRSSGMGLNLYGDERPDVSVFAVSFLGFGSDQARELAVDLLVRDSLQQAALVVGSSPYRQLRFAIAPNATIVLGDPCLAEGAEESMVKPLELLYDYARTIGYQLQQRHRAQQNVFTVRLVGRGSYARCQQLLSGVAKVAKQERTSCNLGRSSSVGELLVRRQASMCEAPLIGTNFVPWDQFQFVGLGELHHTSRTFFNTTGQFEGARFLRNTARLCSTSWQDLQTQLPPTSDFERRRNLLACFKASWIVTWLATILRMPLASKRRDTTDLLTTSELAGVEVDWKLGAIVTESIRQSAAQPPFA